MWRGRFFAFCRGAAVFVLVAVSAGVAAGSGLKPGEDEWLARFVAWHQVNEFRALASPRSANLAWFEAPLLRSYLYLFSATGDTFWLERFVFHSDSVLRVMRDVPDSGRFWCGYQDGFTGWGTTVYDPAGFYQAVPDSMARVLWQSLVLDLQNDCWVWGHWPAGGLGQRWADVAHANIDISFALAMQEGGRVFGAGDLARFGRTLLRVVRY